MARENIGRTTVEEKREILGLFERMNGLKEILMRSDTSNNDLVKREELYERVVMDLGRTKVRFDQWWSEKGKKYQWKPSDNGNWMIDFDTNEIFLQHPDE